jgi:hypothetical protein
MPYWDEHRETDIGHPVPGRERMFAESDINLFFEIVLFYFFLTEFDESRIQEMVFLRTFHPG